MKDIHRLSIPHHTVLNYTNNFAFLNKSFMSRFPYELSSCPIRSAGTRSIFASKDDGITYSLCLTREKDYAVLSRCANLDTLSATQSIDDVLRTLPSLSDNLSFIVDGNPIYLYLLPQHFFTQHGISFDVRQVIELTNEYSVAEAHRHGSGLSSKRGGLAFLSAGFHESENRPNSAKRILDQPNLIKGEI